MHLHSRKMANKRTRSSGEEMKYSPPQANTNCACCQEVSRKLDTVLEILAEYKVLLHRVLSQNVIAGNLTCIFPIGTEEELEELNGFLETQSEQYIREMKNLIGGKVERNLHQVLSQNIIMNFNVDGTFGKKRLRDFGNVYAAIIEVISTITDSPEKTLRAAFQRQKKKYFKQKSRNISKGKVQVRKKSSTSVSDLELV